MLSVRNAGIKQKLMWIGALASTSALVLAAGAFFAYHLVTMRGTIVRTLAVQADTIGLNSTSALRFRDERAARETLAALRADRNIVTAAVYDAGGTVFATYVGSEGRADAIANTLPAQQASYTRTDGWLVHVYHAIVDDGERVGTVHLAYSLAELRANLIRYVAIAVVVLILSVAAAMLLMARIQHGLTESIARLVSAAEVVSREKNYAVRVTPTSNRDEMGGLIDTFNEMLAQIQAREVEVEAGRERFQALNDELEQRVQRRTEELEATNKELEAFTYSVSHDLRAPLRRIDGFANLLVDQQGAQISEEGKHYLRRIRESTRHMGQLVDDLLNLARLGRKELTLRVTGLSSVVEASAAAVAREAPGRVIEWRIQPLPFVECDPALMDVVFTNLLSNAVKYTRPRSTAVIEIGVTGQNGQLAVYVRDNGVGFSMKYADKLFGVFQRLHRPEDFEGTGVGLATVQRIVHKHGGKIWVEAELDKGACFYFTLGTVGAHGEPTLQEAVTL